MKTKKIHPEQITQLPKVFPIRTQATITLGGEKIKIGIGTVPYSEGVSTEQLMKKLTEAAKKNLFPITAIPANE